jgi:hypothetical protein
VAVASWTQLSAQDIALAVEQGHLVQVDQAIDTAPAQPTFRRWKSRGGFF